MHSFGILPMNGGHLVVAMHAYLQCPTSLLPFDVQRAWKALSDLACCPNRIEHALQQVIEELHRQKIIVHCHLIEHPFHAEN